MSSLIEQAAKRLEELRRAGIEIPPVHGAAASTFGDSAFADTVPVDEPLRQQVNGAVMRVAERRAIRPVVHHDEPATPAPPVATPGRTPEAPESAAASAPLAAAPAAAPAVPRESAEVVRMPRPHLAEPARRVEIDLARLAGMGYLVPAQAQSLLADLLRVIKRPLLQNIDRPADMGGPMQRGNVIVVTSAVPGEGKTFAATNLAMSIAMEVDRAALLIDGDVLRPSVFNRLALEPQTGLMDALVNPRLAISDLLVGTNVPKLTLLSAGTAQDRAEELLASAAMDTMLDELSERFHDRVIIIDSPPLLVTTESRALAERAGQVVLVVEADRTPREQITRAMETLANCPIVLSVLNKSRAIESDYVYGY